MSSKMNEIEIAHQLWGGRILAGLFLFWAGMLWAELPGCHGQERTEGLAWSEGQERTEGLAWGEGQERMEGLAWSEGQERMEGLAWGEGQERMEGLAWGEGQERMEGLAWGEGQEQMEGLAQAYRQIAAAGQAGLDGSDTGQQGSADLKAASEGAVYYVNSDTNYRIYIEDRAELLTEDQRLELSQAMQGITAYGNAAFLTTDNNAASTESLARSYYMERFGTASGTVFVIDMDNRNIWIHSDGAVYKVITSAYADTVTDNVYRYASAGDYYECAREVFAEIHALLEGQRIAQPMKYISNALLAMILALLANFGLVICLTRLRKPGENALLSNIYRKFRYTKPNAVYTHQTKTYDPVSSGGGSSGGSGGGSSGGGGGGGSSGGGGGHSF